MLDMLIAFGIPVLIILVALVVIGLVVTSLYQKASPEEALVKTGSGGLKVIKDGGTIVIGAIHNLQKVNMKTLGLEIARRDDDALITKNRMRVDVGAKFYVRVKPDSEGIATAAQTLGDRTYDVNALRQMIEDKLVDALRSVAATMTMNELHENRADFVQQVQNTVAGDLKENGLELESVSLTTLDQTPFENLDENNAFNAQGMRELAEVIAESKKRRAEIDADANVKIAEAEKEAELRKLEISREAEQARIAEKEAIAARQAEADARMAADRSAAERAAQQAEIERAQAIEVAEQDRKIAVNEKSMAESQARKAADEARADAVAAQESVVTAKEVAEAERQKQIELIDAQKQAERQATQVRIAAEAERAAAEDWAAAVREKAQADSDAAKLAAEATEAQGLADAATKKALAEAENGLSPEVVKMRVDLARLEVLPDVVEQMVKPAEQIDHITLHHVTGLGSGSGKGGGAPVGGAVGGVTDAVLNMALQTPAMKALGEAAGVNIGAGLNGVLADTTGTPLDAEDDEPADDGELAAFAALEELDLEKLQQRAGNFRG